MMQCRRTPHDLYLQSKTTSLLALASRPLLHSAICDSCSAIIVGSRFKCMVCSDFDLCGDCEKLHSHEHDASHPFLRMDMPVANSAEVLKAVLLQQGYRAESVATQVRCSCGRELLSGGSGMVPGWCVSCANCALPPLCSCCADTSRHTGASRHAFIIWRQLPPPVSQGIPLLWPEKDEARIAIPDSPATVTLSWSDLFVRSMAADDLDAVLQIEVSSFSMAYSLETFQELLLSFSSSARCYVAVACAASSQDEEHILGYIILDHVRHRTGRIVSLAVAPAARGQGVAAALLQSALSDAASVDNLTVVKLQVSIENPGAQALYERYGFRTTQRIAGYYKEPRGDVDAWEMQCILPEQV